MAKVIKYDYTCVPTVRAFVFDNHKHKCIIGPVGSGKSSGCVMALLRYAMKQEPDSDRIRHTRFVIVRNTVKELKDTTKKTIDEWISPLNPVWKESENKYLIQFKLDDGTIVNSEWLLRALDRPDQVKDLLSLELSGAWLNEAREIPKEVFDMLDGRIGRFPARRGSYGCTYPFIICDSNPPDTDNWLYKYFEEMRLNDEDVAQKAMIFRQPSGLSPEAENLPNLPENYYQDLLIGKDEDFIRVYIHGEYGYVREGKPVFPNFSYSVHVSQEPIPPVKSIPIVIGMDFGLFPACVLTQQTPKGQLFVLDEIITEEATDIEEFTKSLLLPLLNQKRYWGITYYIIGDPAGNARSQLDSRTCFQLLRSFGLTAYPAYTNALQARLQAVNQYLTRIVEGKPAFQVSPACSFLIRALSGKYTFRRLRVSGERYMNVPDKNIYSHVADALTYACLGYTPSYGKQRLFNYDDVNFPEPSNNQSPKIRLVAF